MSTTDILDIIKKVKAESTAGAFQPAEEKSLVYNQDQSGAFLDPESLTPADNDVISLFKKVKQGSVETPPALEVSKTPAETEAAAKQNLATRNEFMRGLYRGIDTTQAAFYGGLGMYSAAMGDTEAADRRFQQYQEQMRQASENPATVDQFFSTDPQKGAFGSVGNFGTWVAGTGGSLIPSVVEAGAAGVAGAAIGGAIVPAPDPGDVVTVPAGFLGGVFGRAAIKKAMAEASQKYVEKGVAKEVADRMGRQAVNNVLAKRAGGLAAAQRITALQEGGGMYAEGREAGYDNPWSAILFGEVSGLTEIGFGNMPFAVKNFIGRSPSREAIKNADPRTAAGYIWDAVKNTGEEGVQEGFQEFLGSVNETINEPEKKLLTKENFMQWAEAGAAGALAGAGFGAAGAASSALQDRAERLKKLKEKGFISEEDATEAGIEGNSRRERMANVESEINRIEQEMQAQDTPDPEIASMIDGMISEGESDDEFARQQAGSPTPQAPQVEAPITPTPLYEVAGDENMVARVWQNPQGFLVNLTDIDSGEVFPTANIFPTFEQAKQHADTVRLPQQPQAAPEPTDTFTEYANAWSQNLARSRGTEPKPLQARTIQSLRETIDGHADYAIKMGRSTAFVTDNPTLDALMMREIQKAVQAKGYQVDDVKQTTEGGTNYIGFNVIGSPQQAPQVVPPAVGDPFTEGQPQPPAAQNPFEPGVSQPQGEIPDAGAIRSPQEEVRQEQGGADLRGSGQEQVPAQPESQEPPAQAEVQVGSIYEPRRLSEQERQMFDESRKAAAESQSTERPRPDEPPLASGMTRLYHGSAEKGRLTGSAWYSTDRQYAANYRDNAELQYIDVPTDWVNQQIDPDNYGQTVDKGFTLNVQLDSSDVGSRKVLLGQAEGAAQAEPLSIDPATVSDGESVDEMRKRGMSEDEIQDVESSRNYFNVVGDPGKASDKDLNRAYGFSNILISHYERKGQEDMAESIRREQEAMKREIKDRNERQEDAEDENAAMDEMVRAEFEAQMRAEQAAPSEKKGKKRKKPRSSKKDKSPTTTEQARDANRKKLDELYQQFKDELNNKLRSGLDPKLVSIAVNIARVHIKDKVLTFAVFVEKVSDRFSADALDEIKPYFESAWRVAHSLNLTKDPGGKFDDVLASKAKQEKEAGQPQPELQGELQIPVEGKPFTFIALHNKEKSPDMGSRFGQDKEPAGRYVVAVSDSNTAAADMPDKFDRRTVTFQNPLVIEFGGGYQEASNWKQVLSGRYGGLTGKALSQAIVDDGFDGIVTVEPAKGANRPAHTSEIVDLSTIKAEGKPAKPAPAESDTDKTLRQAGLKVEQLPDGTWQITGNTYENSKEIGDAKREVPDLKGWWDPRLKRWTFKRDPRREIADRIASRATRDEPVDDAGSDEQMAREDARREQDAIADIQRSGEDYVASVDQSTKDLVARGLKFGMTQEVVDNQIEDIGRVVVAAEENLPMFVIGSAPGTGKTFVLGGVIRELRRRGFKKFVYVTQNENLISQVQGNLADYGLEGVEFTTYAKSREKPLDTSGAVLLLDEAHTAKNGDRETGKKISRMVKASTFTVYATATPFENVSEAEYLGYSGIFDGLNVEFTRPSNNPNRPFRNTLSGFDAWAWMFGAKVFFVKQTDYKGDTYMVPVVWWDKHQTAEEDQFAANEWLKKRGVYVQRPMSLPAGTVKSEMRSIEADPYWADISNRVVEIYADAESQAESNQEKGDIKRHKKTVLKRLLELAKVDAAIARAKEVIGEGKEDDSQVIIFVNYKSDLDLGTFELSEPYRDRYKIKGKEAKRRYTPSQMDEMMRQWYQAKALAKQTGDDAGPPPFARFIHRIAMVMDEAGLLEKFPSVIDKIMDAFPGQAVEFSGRSASENPENLAKWKNNEAKLIVATMDKGGTGLSFHDTTGKMPSRYQINMNLPWSGTKVEQVSGRLARYGTAKPVNIEWIFANNIPFDRELSKTVGSRMRSMSAAVQGTKSGDAKRIRDFDFEEDQEIDTGIESPWLNASVEDENRWAGTTVSVSPKGKEEGYEGTVVRVLNKGETIEIQRDGFDSSTRVSAERVSVINLVDSKAGSSTEQADKAAKILSDKDPYAESSPESQQRRKDINEAWSDMRSYYQLAPDSTIEVGLRDMIDGFVSGDSKPPRVAGNPDGKAYEYTGGDKRLNAIKKRAQTIANKTGAVQAIVVVDNKARTSIPAHAVIVSSPGFVGSEYNPQDSKHFAWVNSLTKLYPEMIVDVIVPSEKKIGKKSIGASELKPRDRFVDSDGQTWEVFSSRGGVVIAHPVVDGKPQVNRDSQVSFAVTDAAKSRHPEYKTDIVSVTKWKGEEEVPVSKETQEDEEEAEIDSGSEKGDERAEADKESAGRVVGGKTKVGKRKAHYEVVELRMLIGSHHPFGLTVNEDFPKSWQEKQRRYEDLNASQKQQVWMPSGGFDPDKVVDPTRGHERGPTMVIDKDGKLYVVGGTRRYMMIANLQRAFPEKAVEYQNALVAEAETFGLDPEAINSMESPILIRVIEEYEDVPNLIDQLNADPQFAKDVATEAASLGRGVGKNTIAVLRDISDDETLSNFLNRKGVAVAEAMAVDNPELIQKMPGWVQGKSLTKDAKLAIQKAIMGAVIPDATLISQASPRILQSINGSLPEILSLNQKGGEWSLSERLKEAITYDAEFRSTGKASSDRNIDYWMNDPQMTFLEGFKKDPNSDGYRLWRYLLNYGGARKFRIALQKTMIKEARLDVELGGLFAGLADPDVEPSMSGNEAFELLLRSGDIDGQAQQNLDDNLRNLPPPLFQTAPDVNENMWSEALDLSIAAQDAGITNLRDFVAYSVKTIGRDRTLQVSRFLRLAAEVAGMEGVQQAAAVSGITRDQVVTMAKRAFGERLSDEQIEAGITLQDITAFGRNEIGFAPYGTPVPGQAMTQEDFDQPSGYKFNESEYRPAVVSYARDKWGDAMASNGKPTWQNFVRWFGDSKVVDKDGKPLVVYHGGQRTIDSDIVRTPFFYMTANRSEAEYWAGENGRVHEVYLKFTKPYRDSQHDDRFMDMEERAQDYDWDDPEFAEELREVTREAVSRMNELKGQGYNSIVMQGEADENYDNYIAFDPSQIKSATGNAGTFDPSNPNMLMQRATQTDTPAFKAWFGDSKVVDEDGKPLVVYHGRASGYDILKGGMGVRTGLHSEGIWFTPNPDFASEFAKYALPEGGAGSNVVAVYLSIKNPATVYNEELRYVRVADLKAQGYDGAYDAQTGAWIAFDSEQIKSATGNRGTFNPNNPNMLYQKGKQVDADTIPKAVLSKMSDRLRSMGYDSRGAEDVRRAIKDKSLLEFNEDWIAAYQFAIGSEQARQDKAAAKKDLKNVNWARLSELGTTANPKEAGYIKPNGDLADLSGKREGGPSGVRSLDHREAGGTAGMQEVIAYGWVRMDENSGSLDIAKMPTPAQLSAITRMAQRKFGEITLDLEDGLGEWSESNGYYRPSLRRWSQQYPEGTKPQRIVNDIKKFFAGSTPNTLLQNQQQGGSVKGWTKFISAHRALIGATNKADFSTFIHEFFHPMRLFLLDKSVPAEKRADITDEEIETLEKASGAGSFVNGKWVTKWDVKAEEKAAKMWEQYWYEGDSPNSVLDSLFQKISRWMREIYSGVQEITGTPLPKEIRDLFDKLVQRGLPADQRGGKGGEPVSRGEPVLRPVDPVTSIKNEVANRIALLRGSPGLVEPEAQTMDEWLEEASNRLRQDPTLGDRLVKELDADPTGPDQIDTAVLQMHYRGLNNALYAAQDRLFAAKDRKDSVAAAKALKEVDAITNSLEEIERVNKKIGTLQARSFAARKITLYADFSRAALERQGRAANGGERLNEKQLRQIAELAAELAKVQGDLAKAEQMIADLQRQDGVRQVVDDDLKKAPKTKTKSEPRQKAATAVQSFVKKFSSIFKPKGDSDTLMQTEDERMAEEAESVVMAYVEAGVFSYGELLANLRKEIGGELPVQAQAAFATAWEKIKAQGEIPIPMVSPGDVEGLTRIAREIQIAIIESGIVTADQEDRAEVVLDAVWRSLQEIDPEITERQTMDALSGYGQFTPISGDEMKRLQRDINGQLLQMAKIKDLEADIRPKATGAQRREMSDEERALVRQVNELKRNSKLYTEDEQGLLTTAIGAAMRATKNRIKDLRKAMDEGKPIAKTQVDLASKDKDLAEQKRILAEVTKDYREMFPRQGATKEQRLAAALRATDREIERVTEQLRTGDFSPRGRAEPVTSVELKAKQAELETLRAHRELIKAVQNKESIEKRAELAYIANLKNRYAEYEDRITHGYFGAKPKKAPLESDEITKHRRRLEEKKEEFFRLAAEWRLSQLSPKERVFDWARETSFLARAIMTSMDLSAVFRQGGPGTFAHPMLAREAAKEMRRAIFSQEVEFQIAENIKKHRLYPLAVQTKLDITTSAGAIQNQEEAFYGRWARDGIGKKGTKINKISKAVLTPVAMSARAYTTYLNGLRFRLFVYFVDTLGANGQVTLDEAKAIANFINVSTGRGDFGSFNKVAANLSTVLFAPRYLASRFAYLGLPFYMLQDAKVSGRVKRLIAMEYARHALGVAGFLATAVALGGLLYDDDDEESPTVELDPRSTDFMKLKIGETRIDPLSGFGQIVTFLSQVGLGQKKTMEGEIIDIRGEKKKYGQDSTFDLTANFIRKKLAPIPAAGINIIAGEDVVGNKATVATATTGLFIPLAGREVVETLMARGVPEGPAIAMLNILGMSGGTYGPKTKYKNANAEERKKLIEKDLEAMEWDSKDPGYKDFLTKDELERFKQRREQRKQSLVYSASANPKRKDFQDDTTYAKAVAERDKALKTMVDGKIGPEEARLLLLAYWRRNNKTLYERKGQVLVMKDALVERLRQITQKLNQK